VGAGREARGRLAPSAAEIRKGYREALRRFHPDKQPATADVRTRVHATEVFKLINVKMDEYSSGAEH
jgi:DnaJ-class molecular chaperone